MNQEQAKRGLEALKERRDEGEYFGTMWVPQIEERLEKGESLAKCIAICLDTAARWWIQANGSYWPTTPQRETVRRLFEAAGECIEDHGYKKPADYGLVA